MVKFFYILNFGIENFRHEFWFQTSADDKGMIYHSDGLVSNTYPTYWVRIQCDALPGEECNTPGGRLHANLSDLSAIIENNENLEMIIKFRAAPEFSTNSLNMLLSPLPANVIIDNKSPFITNYH